MGTRAGKVQAADLIAVPLPEATKTYTVISHEFLIDTARKELENKGFDVKTEVYKSNSSGNVATAQYRIEYGSDPDLGMLFTWANSYDKSMKFKCAVGGFVRASGASVISDAINNYNRKHTGNADAEAKQTIVDQISAAEAYFSQLCRDKDIMKARTLTERELAEIVGILYFEMGIISGEQAAIIKKEYKSPRFEYTTGPDSLWTCYNHILVSLAKSNPKNWMDQQRLVHMFIMDHTGIQKFQPAVTTDEDAPSVFTKDEAEPIAYDHKIEEGEVPPQRIYASVDPGLPDDQQEVTVFEYDEVEGLKVIEPMTDEEKDVRFDTKTELLSIDQIIEKYGDNLSEADIANLRANVSSKGEKEAEEFVEAVEEFTGKKVMSEEEVETAANEVGETKTFNMRKTDVRMVVEDPEIGTEFDIEGVPHTIVDMTAVEFIITPSENVGKDEAEPERDLDAEEDKEWEDRIAAGQLKEVEPQAEVEEIQPEDVEAAAEKFDQIVEEETTPEMTFMSKADVESAFPGQGAGSIIEIEGNFFELLEIEGDDENFAFKPVDVAEETGEVEEEKPEPVLPAQATEEDVKKEEPVAEEQEEAPAEMNMDAVEKEGLKAGPIMSHEDIEILPPEEDKADDPDPIRNKIQQELLDIYGGIKEFTFEKKGDQYNVTLSTGETVTLMEALVEVE